MGATHSSGAHLERSSCPRGDDERMHCSSATVMPESVGSGCLWMRAAFQAEDQVRPLNVNGADESRYNVTSPPHCPVRKQTKNNQIEPTNNGHRQNAPTTTAVDGVTSSMHQTNTSMSSGGSGDDLIKATSQTFSSTSTITSVKSPISSIPASSLHVPSSPPFLGRPVQISNLKPPINLTSTIPGTVNSDTEWYAPAMILDSSDTLWNAWMSTDKWLKPPWFITNASISERDEALIKESIAALHVGRPFQEALRKENVRRQKASERARISNTKELSPVSVPIFDPITFLSCHFYEGLFFTLPVLRRQFKSPIETQGKKMVQTLVHILTRFAGESRTNPDSDAHVALLHQFKDMCRRHLKYQVKMNHYNMVGEALFHSLQYCIGEAWTPAMCSAWVRLYSFVVEHILNFMEQLAEEANDIEKPSTSSALTTDFV